MFSPPAVVRARATTANLACARAQLVYMERMRLDFEEWWLSPPPRPWNLPSVWLLNGGAAAVGCAEVLD